MIFQGRKGEGKQVARHLETHCTDFLSYKIASDCIRLHQIASFELRNVKSRKLGKLRQEVAVGLPTSQPQLQQQLGFAEISFLVLFSFHRFASILLVFS